MKLVFEGHNYDYDIRNLVKVFFPYDSITITDSVSNEDTIKTMITDNSCVVEYYKEGRLISQLQSTHQMDNRKEIKNLLKRVVYQLLSEVTNVSPPWGILTGIRPTKIVFDLIEKYRKDTEKIREILSKDYCISGDKIDLMLEIVTKEIEIINGNKDDQVSIYIGIPFCPTRCLYCSFTSYPIDKWQSKVKDYLVALEQELAYATKNFLKNKSVRTLYVGGGTPTSLNEQQFELLMKIISKHFNIDTIEEFSVEAGRPDTITKEKLEIMKQYGVDRISINPQTMNQDTLDRIGRGHWVEDIYKVFNMARALDFNNINMDLILGLPGETLKDIISTIDQIKQLDPDSITVHTMAVKRASRLKQTLDHYELLEEDDLKEQIYYVYREAGRMGLKPYYMYRQKNMVGNFENVGYSKEGKESIYNILIMEENQTIVAFGAGAVTKIVFPNENRIERVENVKDVDNYINRVEEMVERKKKFFEK